MTYAVLNRMKKLQWNLKRNSYNFVQENAFENVACEMATKLSLLQCVDNCHLQKYGPFFACLHACVNLRFVGMAEVNCTHFAVTWTNGCTTSNVRFYVRNYLLFRGKKTSRIQLRSHFLYKSLGRKFTTYICISLLTNGWSPAAFKPTVYPIMQRL